MVSLDGGSIRVLGHEVKSNAVLRVGNRVGYMPQEAAVVGELTVKETIFYFGNIFEMELKKLNERFVMLRDLLELPSDDVRLENCSGGEQRRVSFAVAIVHEPDLLILDEPTVGLDPILRDKIWSFLVNTTRTSDLAVIVTTHYIAEAQKADCVGLLRHGILLDENSPIKIIERHKVENLENAFLEMCIKQNSFPKPIEVLQHVEDVPADIPDKPFKAFKRCRKLRWQIVKELMTKHYRKFRRQPL